MPLFDTPAIKDLKNQAGQIGTMYGQVFLGRLSAADLEDAVGNEGVRSGLRRAYAAATADVGEAKAMKAAVSSGRLSAESYAGLGRGNYAGVIQQAERAIRSILATQAPADSGGPRQVLTINGRPQPQPETYEGMERRFRLFVECARRLADSPLAQETARGRLVGDGSGLESLVAVIAPLFEREQSIIRWVALRAAFASLHKYFFDERAPASAEDLAEVMGLAWVDENGQPWRASSTGMPSFAVRDPRQLPAEQARQAADIAWLAVYPTLGYNRLLRMTLEEVNNHERFSFLNDVLALDCIAWSAVATLRMGFAQRLFPIIPEPDALPEPCWYTDPVIAKYDRYWDGADWTPNVSTKGGKRSTIPLR